MNRSKSQTVRVTTQIRNFISITEHERLSTFDKLNRHNAYLLKPKPVLFVNLRMFLDRKSKEYLKILNLFGGATSNACHY